MSAIPCASVSLKTMADGTLRVSFDIEPAHAQDAFRLFASPGTPAAIAALQVGYAAVGEPVVDKPKGGPLSKLAGVWCNDPGFLGWIWEAADYTGSPTPEGGADVVRNWCRVESRAELDHDDDAAERFHRLIRGPFSKYMQTKGAAL